MLSVHHSVLQGRFDLNGGDVFCADKKCLLSEKGVCSVIQCTLNTSLSGTPQSIAIQ